jgi:transcription initiation factor IIE alpha subunit
VSAGPISAFNKKVLFLAIVIHHKFIYRLKDDDLAGRVGLQVKELNKLMATLEKDGLIQA